MVLELTDLCKRYGRLQALDRVNLQIESGELVSILGPSGSGKTTLLKIIAGIERPTGGSIGFGRKVTNSHPVVIVFQDYVLFPHMTVFENVAFGLRARSRGRSRREIHERVHGMLDYFGIGDKAASYPAHISGGQRQRVAIARAIIVNPYLLLLDEPFANLDQNLKMETAEFIRQTQQEFGITIVSVTHDQQEALATSDRVGVLLNGRLEQFDRTRQVYFEPRTREVAEFLGPVNAITREVEACLTADSIPHQTKHSFFRAEGVELIDDPTGGGVVEEVRFVGLGIIYHVRTGSSICRVHAVDDIHAAGSRVSLRLHRVFNIPDSG